MALHDGWDVMIETELSRLADSTLTESEKDNVIAEAASKLSGLCVKIAQMHARYPGLVWSRDGDDLVQLVQELAILKLRKIAHEGERGAVNFEVLLSSSARGVIRDYADSGQNTMMARGGAAHRRSRVEFVRREMDALIATPPGESRVAASRFTTLVFNNDVENTSSGDASGHLEMQSTIDRTLDECARQASPTMLAVARDMFSWFPEGSPPSVADIARHLGLSYSTAKRRYEEVGLIFERANAD